MLGFFDIKQLPTYVDNVTLITFAAVSVVRQSVDISCPLGPQQQTRCTGMRRLNDGMNRRMDGSSTCFLDCSIYYASSVMVTIRSPFCVEVNGEDLSCY